MPKSNTEYWNKKITGNVERDKNVIVRLEELGWNVITVWECQLKKAVREQTLSDLIKDIIQE